MARRTAVNILLAWSLLLPGALAAQESGDAEREAASVTEELERLERRIEELEEAKAAHEDATREIIRQTIAESETKINKFVFFGGTFEHVVGWAEDFRGKSERVMGLNTAELDFEIQVNDWSLGSLILEYDDGTDINFPTTSGGEAAVDRINLDTAFLVVGNTEKAVPFATIGRMIVPFGISTGDPVADVLTLEDPLTVEVFETREDALLIGFAFPTPTPPPLIPRPSPPSVKPRVLNPLLRWIGRGLGYRPPPIPPPPQTFTLPGPTPPPFSAAFYAFDGNTRDRFSGQGWRPGEHFGATVGFRTPGPWSIDVDVDYNNSVFDSRFLEFEYGSFLRQIGLVPGMAASLKLGLGPVPFLAEWNGALEEAKFTDDAGRVVTMRPSAWQISVGYQLDWNRGIEANGAQGTYLAAGYSESRELAGVTQVIDGEASRVGQVPKGRFLLSAGEWILDGVRVAVEYSWIKDYEKSERGTGEAANGVFSMVTYEW